jgi:hypothetical protein
MADVTSPFGFPYPEDTDLVRDGASDIENLAEGVNDYLAGGYLYAGTRYYTSSGSFLKADPFGAGDIGLRAIRVRMVGGGGAGGGVASVGGAGGGGGGAYAESFITDIASLTSSVVVTRGAGGTGGTGNGPAGGTSSFGALVTANGGDGGLASGGPALGSDVGTGDIVFSGSGGTSGSRDGTTVPASRQYSGAGGSSHLGGGGRGLIPGGSNEAGFAGLIYGGGGGGARFGDAGGASVAGGSGANGLVAVDCFV